ncbi:MAG: hypothetical protein OER04_03385 [Cyclobacteriaceae bacterium]|nr:hypothetical protein [Cyclobacteriaceae bacterium]
MVIYGDRIRTYTFEWYLSEEEGPSGLPVADTCFIVKKELLILEQ